VRSVSRYIPRAGVLAVCALLIAGALTGCTTTQEKAARQQARSKRILEARERKHEHRAHHERRSGKG
jgi:hypothetical protein